VCAQVGSKAEEFPILRGLFNNSFFSARLDDCLEQGIALLRLARELAEDSQEVEALRVVATVSYFRGDFMVATEHAQTGVELYDPQRHRELAFVYGADPLVVCSLYAALSMWALGQPERAEATMRTAVERANELGHGHTLAFALGFRAMLDQLCGDVGAARESAAEAVRAAPKGRIRQWEDWSRVILGWAQAMDGDFENGLAVLEQGLTDWRHSLVVPYFLGLKAQVLSRMQRLDEALETVAKAISLAEDDAQRANLAELYRLRGGILIGLSETNRAAAETAVLRAVEVARLQQARSFELRALTSLVRLRNGRDGATEARTWLAECYGAFTEGLDTGDLRAAKALLKDASAVAS